MSYVEKELVLAKAKRTEAYEQIKLILDEIPDADAEAVRHGTWIKDNTYKNNNKAIYRCSVCNHWQAVKKDKHPNQINLMNYCSFCGAKMDEFKLHIETYGFSKKIVRLARDIAIEKTQRPHPKYISAILKKWYDQGLRTYEDVKKYVWDRNTDIGEGNSPGGIEYEQ